MSKASLQQATENADLMMQGTLTAVKPELTWVHGPSLDRSCSDYEVDGRATGSISRNVVVMTVVSKARRGSLLGLIERYWKAQNYEITSVDSDEETPAIFARTSQGFRMSVSVEKKGQFFFNITTPCFITSEVEAPKAPPNGAPFEGPVVPDPYVRSDFWSATTAIPLASPSR
ncbi:hypothetical protein [Streptomyces sp. NPDC059155]|uniref:hypothetical protein n=1 Tax=unclassified Streptomyces TaxID=2593676 RepID=UPI0036753A23